MRVRVRAKWCNEVYLGWWVGLLAPGSCDRCGNDNDCPTAVVQVDGSVLLRQFHLSCVEVIDASVQPPLVEVPELSAIRG